MPPPPEQTSCATLRLRSTFLCRTEDVKNGIIGTRIAAHAADIVKGVKGAADWDRKMSTARKNLDWEEQIRLSLDPEKARRLHSRFATEGERVQPVRPLLCYVPGGEISGYLGSEMCLLNLYP